MTLDPRQLGYPLKIIRRVVETEEAVSLVLEIPTNLAEKFKYQAGQFVTFFLEVDGQAINRSYSLSSAPGVDDEFKVTIKKVAGGRGSTYLCTRAREGDQLLTAPPAGQFFKGDQNPRGTHYFLFAAGSGITPVFSVLKTVLTASALNRVTLIFANRFDTAIIYKSEIEAWAKRFPQNLDVVHLISKPSPAWAGRTGRLSRELIHDALETPTTPAARAYYVCGPGDFMGLIKDALTEFGVPAAEIRSEDFAISLPKEKVDVDAGWTFIGDSSEPAKPLTLVAEINGAVTEVAAKEGQTILETLLEAGADAPYSCMNGSCMACIAKISAGRVYQEDPGILTDDNIEAGEMLTCQAKPLSKLVKFSYDEL